MDLDVLRAWLWAMVILLKKTRRNKSIKYKISFEQTKKTNQIDRHTRKYSNNCIDVICSPLISLINCRLSVRNSSGINVCNCCLKSTSMSIQSEKCRKRKKIGCVCVYRLIDRRIHVDW